MTFDPLALVGKLVFCAVALALLAVVIVLMTMGMGGR